MSQVIFLVGPTASGKSRLALEAAQEYNAEILNADSIQTYKTVNIGSAKPSDEEQKLVRHHLINFVDEGDTYTAGRFRRDALKMLEERFQTGVKKIYVVGGSGFYIQALLRGLYPIPAIAPEIREKVKSTDKETLFKELKERDPDYALKISEHDTYRLQRSIEVIRQTGKPFTEFKKGFQQEKFPYTYKNVGIKIQKELLVKRIELRVQKMLKNGWIEETKELISRGLEKWHPMQSVGYKEVIDFLNGTLTKDDLIPEIVKSTTSLAKRQMTWFKRDPETFWFDCESQWQSAMNKLGE